MPLRPILYAIFCCTSLLGHAHANHNKELGEAAKFAMLTGNIDLLEALMKAGLDINEPILWDEEMNDQLMAVNIAVYFNEPRVVEFLVRNGANVLERDRFDLRPIDMALRHEMTDMYEILRQPTETNPLVNDYPRDMIDELLYQVGGQSKRLNNTEAPTFISLNGEDPSKEMLEVIATSARNPLPRSEAIILDLQASRDLPSQYQHRDTKAFGDILEIDLKKVSDTRYDWKIHRDIFTALSGFTAMGTLEYRYGYWISTTTEAMDH